MGSTRSITTRFLSRLPQLNRAGHGRSFRVPVVVPVAVLASVLALAFAASMIAGAGVASATSPSCEQAFSYTGAEQSCVVPPGVTSLPISAVGAAGGSATDCNDDLGAPGGAATGTLPVTSGETLYIEVGGQGADDGDSSGGGFNGGGDTGFSGRVLGRGRGRGRRVGRPHSVLRRFRLAQLTAARGRRRWRRRRRTRRYLRPGRRGCQLVRIGRRRQPGLQQPGGR